MSQEKSRIDSFNVSMGGVSSRPPQVASLDKWNVLVCSDLGFVSKTMHGVRIADWNEFMASCGITLRGSAPFEDHGPLFFECPVASMKDFSVDTLTAKAPLFAPYSKTIFALKQLVEAKTSVADATALIRQSGIHAADRDAALAAIGSQTPEAPVPQAPKQAFSPLDNILSMVSTAPSDGGLPHTATEALFKSVGADNAPKINTDKIIAQINFLTARLSQMVEAVTGQQFFYAKKASWAGLQTLAKVVGRKKDIDVHVFSAQSSDMEDQLPRILSSCMEQGFAPDIIVWDYLLSFSNADMQLLGRISSIAEQYKSMLISPLSMQETLFKGISSKNDVTHIFDSVAMLPYKSMRKSQPARCICLCGPTLAPQDAVTPFGPNACWFVASRWAEMVLSEMNPFAAKEILPPHDSIFALSRVFGVDVSKAVVSDASQNGITLFEASVHEASLDKCVTIIDNNQVAPCYCSFLFNLLVNRVVRIAGIRLLMLSPSHDKRSCAVQLQNHIAAELAAYHAISQPGQVSAHVDDDGKITINIDSNETIAGNAIRFTFSF